MNQHTDVHPTRRPSSRSHLEMGSGSNGKRRDPIPLYVFVPSLSPSKEQCKALAMHDSGLSYDGDNESCCTAPPSATSTEAITINCLESSPVQMQKLSKDKAPRYIQRSRTPPRLPLLPGHQKEVSPEVKVGSGIILLSVQVAPLCSARHSRPISSEKSVERSHC